MPEEEVKLDTQNEQEEVVTPAQNDESVEAPKENKREFSDYEKQLYNQLQKEKAKREELEGKLKTAPAKEEAPKQETNALSQDDVFELFDAGIRVKEDRDFFIQSAKLAGLTIQEARKNKTIMALLKEQQEERATAQATSTGGGQRGTATVPDDALLRSAQIKGELPESDEDIRRLIKARQARK